MGYIITNDYNGRSILFEWDLVSQDAETNTSLINWRLTSNGTAQRYALNQISLEIDGVYIYQSDTSLYLYDGTAITSGNLTIAHDSDGSCTFNASVNADVEGHTLSGAKNFELTTISRVSEINSVTATTSGGSITVDVTKYANFSDNLYISFNNTIIDTITNYSGQAFTLSESAQNTINTALTTASIVTLDFYIETYSGATLIGTSNYVTKTLTLSTTAPTIGSAVYGDGNSATVAITGDNRYIIQNKSVLELTLTDIEAHDSATLNQLSISGGGVDMVQTLSGTSIDSLAVTVGTIDQSAGFDLKITITDSRGKQVVKTLAVLVYTWQEPSAIITAERIGNYYADTEITVDANFNSLGGNNSISIVGKYKKTTDTTWSADVNFVDGTTQTITLDNNYEWNLRVVVSDRITSTTYNIEISRGLPLIFFDKLKNSIGVNCFPTNEDSLEVSGVDVIKALQTQDGDTMAITSAVLSGIITSETTLNFTIPLLKATEWLTASFNHLEVEIYGNNQKSNTGEIVGNSNYTINTSLASDNLLNVEIIYFRTLGFSQNTAVNLFVDATIVFTS